MSVTHVNAGVSIDGTSSAAAAYTVTIPGGTGIVAGDLIVGWGAGNFTGTRVSKGMKLKDSVNSTNYTIVDEVEQGGSSSHWAQLFYFQTTKAIPDGSTFTFTPSSGSTANAFVVDVYRGTTGAIVVASTKQSNTAGTSQGAAALGSDPASGSLVITADASTSGTLSAGTPFTTASVADTGQAVALGHVLSASGSSAYSSTWTDTGSQTSATMTVAFGGSGGGSPTISTSSPLPDGTVGTPYSDQLVATGGGGAPFTWSVSSGSPAAGLSLQPGGGSGGAAYTYAGLQAGPQSAPTSAGFTAAQAIVPNIGFQKVFYSSGGSGIYTGYLGGSVNGGPSTTVGGFPGGLEGTITTANPGMMVMISWGVLMSQAAISNYVNSIPDVDANGNQMVVGFTYQNEPEHAYPDSVAGGKQFVADWTDQALKIRSASSLTGARLLLVPSHYMPGYATSSANTPGSQAGAFITGNTSGGVVITDARGADFYEHEANLAGADMSHDSRWVNWLAFTNHLGQVALTENGVDGTVSNAVRLARIQANATYIAGAFGSGGSVNTQPLLCWLYWGTGIGGGATSQYTFTDAATEGQWESIQLAAGQIPGQPSSGGGSGGLLSGTPTTAGTTSATYEVTDSLGGTATKSLSITISAGATLAVTTSSLPSGTDNVPYSAGLFASGGQIPYTWSKTSGSLPAGLTLSSAGVISGTPTATGSPSASYLVTDASSNTASVTLSITIAATLAVTTTSLLSGQASVPYTATLGAANGVTPYTWQLATGSLPDGLSLDPATGIISGTPAADSVGTAQPSFLVTDAAGATATSAVLPLAISASGGGLPPLPRFVFGGGQADFGFAFSGTAMVKAPAATWEFFNAKTGGSQYTDLEDMSDNPITSITTDSSGFAGEFQAPAGVLEMYADANGGAGPRYRVTANNLGDSYVALYNAVLGIVGTA